MTRNDKCVEAPRRTPGIVAGILALAMLTPTGASGLDSTISQTAERQATGLLPLPPIRYLDSMRWMEWKPNAPVFKVDTLLLPDGPSLGSFRLPSQYERDLPRVS